MAPEDINEVSAESESKKAELDIEEISSTTPKEAQKVELDLEDAPFLEEEDEEQEEEKEPESLDLDQKEKGEAWYKRFLLRKYLIPAAAALLVLILGTVAILLFTGGEEPVQVAEPEVETPVVAPGAPPPEEPEPEKLPEYTVSMKPFWIELHDDKGDVRFLICKFAAVTESKELSVELNQKTTVLRDAIFYYLKNKDLTYLSDKKNVEALKTDLLSVINQYMSAARLETLLIEQYMVK